MQRDINEFIQIVEGEWSDGPDMKRPPSDSELRRALQFLLTRQCVYSDMPNLGRLYEILRHYSSFVARYFSALDYELTVSHHDQMIALKVPVDQSRFDTVYQRFTKDEIMVLLSLVLLREEAISRQEIADYGRVEITTGDLIDRIKTVTQQEPPDEPRLVAVLRKFSRMGCLRIGERDRIDRIMPLTIMPGVNIVAPDNFIENLRLWAASTNDSDNAKTDISDNETMDAAE
jgi:hypothetical protein